MRKKLIYFNPRSLTGATVVMLIAQLARLFQSTLPYGSDGALDAQDAHTGAFQSTLPYGSDLSHLSRSFRSYEFQSTLPYGSDSGVSATSVDDEDFNPRSLTGATHVIQTQTHPYLFQSTLPYGSD